MHFLISLLYKYHMKKYILTDIYIKYMISFSHTMLSISLKGKSETNRAAKGETSDAGNIAAAQSAKACCMARIANIKCEGVSLYSDGVSYREKSRTLKKPRRPVGMTCLAIINDIIGVKMLFSAENIIFSK